MFNEMKEENWSVSILQYRMKSKENVRETVRVDLVKLRS